MSSIFLVGGKEQERKKKRSTFAAAALCFEIATSIAGLKKHIYSYITVSEDISEKG